MLGFLLFCTSIGLKMFIVESFYVPSGSMESSVLGGESLIVNKLVYGPRIPRSPLEIPWFNIFALNNKLLPWFEDTHWPYRRLHPEHTPARNDIVVFEGPWESKAVLIKRCKALPNEIVELRSDELLINGTKQPEPPTVRYLYDGLNGIPEKKITASLPIPPNQIYYGGAARSFLLHPDTAVKVNRMITNSKLTLSQHKQLEKTSYGPFWVPAKGAHIYFNDLTCLKSVYVSLINQFEGDKAELIDDVVVINGSQDSTYTFKNDYYFMMGDNRYFSDDSRIWGPVPESSIIGKAIFVWYSTNQQRNEVRWNRIFTGIE